MNIGIRLLRMPRIRLEGFTPQPATPLGRPPCRARYPGILGFLTPGSSSRDLLGGRRLITIIYELHKYEQIFWYENHSNWLLLQLCMRSPDIKTAGCGVIVEWPTEGCGRLRGESFYCYESKISSNETHSRHEFGENPSQAQIEFIAN